MICSSYIESDACRPSDQYQYLATVLVALVTLVTRNTSIFEQPIATGAGFPRTSHVQVMECLVDSILSKRHWTAWMKTCRESARKVIEGRSSTAAEDHLGIWRDTHSIRGVMFDSVVGTTSIPSPPFPSSGKFKSNDVPHEPDFTFETGQACMQSHVPS